MLGEKLDYKIQYGWFTIGRGNLWVDSSYHYPTGKQHLKVFCVGKTVGLVGALAYLDTYFESLIDMQSSHPLFSFRNVVFGKRLDIRFDKFDYQQDSVFVDTYVQDLDSERSRQFSLEPDGILDAMSTYVYLRNIPLDKLRPGDSFMLTTFFSNSLYRFGLELIGHEQVKYNGELIDTYKMFLLFPDTEAFPERKVSYVWTTADGRNIPIRLVAKMKYGTFKCELTSDIQ